MMKVLIGLLALGAVALRAASAVSAAGLMGSYGDWHAYRHTQGDDLMCFAVSGSRDESRAVAGHAPPRIYVTAWPGAGIKAEISVLLDFEPGKGSKISVEVGGVAFSLFADADRAYIGDPDAELRLLEAMRRSRTLKLTMPVSSGDEVTANFSLSGLTASVHAIATSCR